MKNSKKRTLLREAGWKQFSDGEERSADYWQPPTKNTLMPLRKAWPLYLADSPMRRKSKQGAI